MKGKKKEILLVAAIFLQKLITAAADVLWLVLLAELTEEVVQKGAIRGGTGKAAEYVLGMILLSVWKRMGYSLGRSLTLKLQNMVRFRMNCRMTEKIAKIPYRLLEDYAFCELKQVLKENVDGNTHERFVWHIVQKSGNLMLYCVRILGISLLLGRICLPLGILLCWVEICHCLMTAQGKWQAASLSEGEGYSPRKQYMEELALGQAGAGERCLFSYTGYISAKCDREAGACRREMRDLSGEFWKRELAGQGLQTIAFVLTEFALAALLTGGRISLGYFVALSIGVYGLLEKNEEGNALYYLQRGRLFLKQWNRFLNLPETEEAGAIMEDPAGEKGEEKSWQRKENGESKESGGAAEEVLGQKGSGESGKDCEMQGADRLEFRNVFFRYPRTGRYVLRDLNFVLTEGGYYAFVGTNGSGKTTIGKLLSGMYDNYEGEILWNGIELREISFRERRRIFAILFQDAAKYEDTIAQNIIPGDDRDVFTEESGRKSRFLFSGGSKRQGELGDKPHTRGEEPEGGTGKSGSVNGIDKRKLAENLVGEWSVAGTDRFPEGADTFLGNMEKDGVILSAGEWQQLLVVRELAQPARVRVLDEPMAAMDVFRQSWVYGQFTKDAENHMTLLFSHHMAAVRNAKRIFVMEEGMIAEEGSHWQLMSKKGLYATMCRAQEADD